MEDPRRIQKSPITQLIKRPDQNDAEVTRCMLSSRRFFLFFMKLRVVGVHTSGDLQAPQICPSSVLEVVFSRIIVIVAFLSIIVLIISVSLYVSLCFVCIVQPCIPTYPYHPR